MPTYEYLCKSCNYEFEEFQPMSADALIICPKCAEPTLKRLMSSGAGLVFKGSGFYLTDYKKTDSKSKVSSSKSETSGGTKVESKSEAKIENKGASETKSTVEKK